MAIVDSLETRKCACCGSMENNNNNKNRIKNGTDPRCRLCKDKVETIDHLVAGCPILAPKEY